MALVERGGRVRAFPLERVTTANLKAAIDAHVSEAARLVTDELPAYNRAVSDRQHDRVNHSDGEYVRGDVHVNSAEGFFALLKRGVMGAFHHVSKGHLHRYCSEFEFRYDRRTMNDGERAAEIVLGAEGKRLTYKQPSGVGA